MPEKKCEHCGTPYLPRQHNQRFCGSVCANAYHQDERRRAVEMLRTTYAEIAQNEADREPGGGPLPSPNWSHDPLGTEPLIEGNSDRLGFALGGAGGQGR